MCLPLPAVAPRTRARTESRPRTLPALLRRYLREMGRARLSTPVAVSLPALARKPTLTVLRRLQRLWRRQHTERLVQRVDSGFGVLELQC